MIITRRARQFQGTGGVAIDLGIIPLPNDAISGNQEMNGLIRFCGSVSCLTLVYHNNALIRYLINNESSVS